MYDIQKLMFLDTSKVCLKVDKSFVKLEYLDCTLNTSVIIGFMHTRKMTTIAMINKPDFFQF